jgi:hypothetical protein
MKQVWSGQAVLLAACFMLISWLIRLLWRWRHVPPKRRLASNELPSVISQKKELFITTAVWTLNSTGHHLLVIKEFLHNAYTKYLTSRSYTMTKKLCSPCFGHPPPHLLSLLSPNVTRGRFLWIQVSYVTKWASAWGWVSNNTKFYVVCFQANKCVTSRRILLIKMTHIWTDVCVKHRVYEKHAYKPILRMKYCLKANNYKNGDGAKF